MLGFSIIFCACCGREIPIPIHSGTQVVFTASALVDLLSAHLGFDEDRGWGRTSNHPSPTTT